VAKDRFSQETVIEALHKSRGMLSVAARALQCSPTTVESYIAKYPAVAEARQQERDAVLDLGELALIRAVQQGEPWAVCFLLKTQGKARGYVERGELTGPDGGPIQVRPYESLSDKELDERINALQASQSQSSRTRDRATLHTIHPNGQDRAALPAGGTPQT
jgi:hypothetical protein